MFNESLPTTEIKKSGVKKVLFFIVLISSLTLGGFFLGVSWGGKTKFCETCQPTDINFSLFWEAYQKLKNRYIDAGKIDQQKILYGAIGGMVDSLDDPYTVFFDPDNTKKFMQDVTGRFEGVGMEIGVKNNTLQVIAPLEGTPAQKAGMRAGDKIIKIDDKEAISLSAEEAVSMIRGPRGTKVILNIFRDGWKEPKDFEIIRETIEVPSLKLESLGNGISRIQLYNFTENGYFDFTKAIIRLMSSGDKKIILDLRNNPGGYLEVANDIAGFFLNRGELVVTEDTGIDKKEYRASGDPILKDYPVVILINKGSASASEILAAALRDNKEIKLVGENSFGKGSVQQLENLSGGSSLKITIAKWLTPKGDVITGKGLKPDIEIIMTEDDYKADRDPQLEKAIELLKGL